MRVRSRTAAASTALCRGLSAAHARAQAAEQQWDQTSPDGLQLTRTLPYGAIYMKPGATFGQYKRLAVLTASCSSQGLAPRLNRNEPDLEMQVSQGDMDRSRRTRCRVQARLHRRAADRRRVRDRDIAAPDVLILRPAILSLIVNAPVIDTAPPMSGSVVASAGQMTLYLELWIPCRTPLLERGVDRRPHPVRPAAATIAEHPLEQGFAADRAGPPRDSLMRARPRGAQEDRNCSAP